MRKSWMETPGPGCRGSASGRDPNSSGAHPDWFRRLQARRPWSTDSHSGIDEDRDDDDDDGEQLPTAAAARHK